jgi:acyl-CoA thioesterase-1
VAGDPALNQGDHMHPNAAGVKQEVARIVPLVERLLSEVK